MLARAQIPNLLTFGRVAAVPLCLAIMLMNPAWKFSALLGIFILAALTDFLDGYLARKWKVVSALGALLDPIADKLLVALMLVYLLLVGGLTPPSFASLSTPAAPRLAMEGYAGLTALFSGSISPLFLPVAIILLRELYISGLREFLSARQIALPVSKSGKWKTALQMLAITLLLTQLAIDPPGQINFPCTLVAKANALTTDCISQPWILRLAKLAGLPLLYVSALLALTSAVAYTRASWKHLR
jgi:phosphatidylglycerophosphate synthase